MSFSDTPHAPPEGIDDDFLDQLFSGPPSSAAFVGAGGFQLGLISEEAALNMSRLSGASTVAELVPVIPPQWIQENTGGGTKQLVWEKCFAKLIVQDVGEAMQFLMPIYLAAATFHSESSNMMIPKPDAPS